jgi:hypothetical protein
VHLVVYGLDAVQRHLRGRARETLEPVHRAAFVGTEAQYRMRAGSTTEGGFGRTGVTMPLAVGSRPQFRECLWSASLPWVNTSRTFWLPLVVFHDLFRPPPILQISCSKPTRRGLSLLLLLI